MWLEDQKIRHYKIEDRTDLRNMTSDKWSETFNRYCDDVACPVNTEPLDRLEWLVGFAVKLEFEDNCKKPNTKLNIQKLLLFQNINLRSVFSQKVSTSHGQQFEKC